MAVVARGRTRHRARFLQPTPTSTCFQEALRLCRHHEDTPQCSGTDDEMDPPEDCSSHHERRGLLSEPGTLSPEDTQQCTSRLKSRDRNGKSLHVQWADQLQQDLVREHPRKRYDRRPSLRVPEPPKSILKRRDSVP